ncbi:MAG: trypsin-like peptidase domain-containing protein [Thermoleophilia bacterium]|nr:trypsin-like peptidase domain-containing protein [Thermoleophilia bacterium]
MDEPHPDSDDVTARELVTTTAPDSAALPPRPGPDEGPPEKPARTGSGGGGRFLAAFGVLILGFGGGVGGFYAADQWSGGGDSAAAAQQSLQPSNMNGSDGSSSTPVADTGSAETPGQIYEQVAPAVVHINAQITTTQSFFGIPQKEEATGTGSGFVISQKGYIVTNAHVVEDAKELTVIFGSDTPIKATLVGLDKSTDVAVIKIDPTAKELSGPLTTVDFANSEAVKVGDPVVAIGNPFSLDRTLTTGVVSALQRDIPSLNDYKISDVIQTDAAVNPGNSGGPLLNMRGDVIGINSQIQSKTGSFAGIAFAVPSNKAKEIADKLIKNGSVKHAWFGISGQDLTADIADHLKSKVTKGIVVASVSDGSPAAKAGLASATGETDADPTPGNADIITRFDGKEVTSMRDLADTVDGKSPGDKVDIEFLHDGKVHKAVVTLGDRPDTSSADTQAHGG